MKPAITHAFSIMQPWAWAILHAAKDIENRTRRCPPKYHDVTLLLHVGLKCDTADTWAWIARVGGIRPPHSKLLPRGAIVGTIRFSGSVEATGPAARDISPWASGLWCWRIAEAQAFQRPLKAKGQLGFWQPKEWTGRAPAAPVVQRDMFGGGR